MEAQMSGLFRIGRDHYIISGAIIALVVLIVMFPKESASLAVVAMTGFGGH